MNKTSIEYLTHTWNPIAMRCTKVSEACENCWHLRTANRLKNNPKLPVDVREALAGDREPFVTDRINQPLEMKKPAVIGVQFMGDLFHENVAPDDVLKVFGRMHKTSQHTFLVLTKRPERALEFAGRYGLIPQVPYGFTGSGETWPDNVWIGVTAENQQRADERIPILLQIPAAVRFVSFEPLLCAINMRLPEHPGMATMKEIEEWERSKIDWAIAGSETGPRKRPMDLDWARSLRDQCRAAGVPFFFKRDSDGNRELDGVAWTEMPGVGGKGVYRPGRHDKRKLYNCLLSRREVSCIIKPDLRCFVG